MKYTTQYTQSHNMTMALAPQFSGERFCFYDCYLVHSTVHWRNFIFPYDAIWCNFPEHTAKQQHACVSHKQPRKNSFATTSFFFKTCAICYLNENYSIKVHSFIKKVIRKLYVILISNFYCPSMNWPLKGWLLKCTNSSGPKKTTCPGVLIYRT